MRGKLFSGTAKTLEADTVSQGKMVRVVALMHLLMHGRYSVKELAYELNCNPRTINRMLNTFTQAGVCVDYLDWEYFIAQDNCPLCGKQPTTTNE